MRRALDWLGKEVPMPRYGVLSFFILLAGAVVRTIEGIA